MSPLPPAYECCALLYSGQSRGVSDGSYESEQDLCTAAWILEFGTEFSLKGGGAVPGPEERFQSLASTPTKPLIAARQVVGTYLAGICNIIRRAIYLFGGASNALSEIVAW